LDITLIELNKIEPNNYNPNIIPDDILAKLRAEIEQKGLCEPIIVRSRGEGYVIVDGFHRWQICRELNWQEVPCIIQDYDDNEAKIKTLQLNYMRGSAIPIKLASLIHELNKEISLEDLAKRLPYEEPQLLDNLELLKLPDDFGKDIEDRSDLEEAELPTVISFVVYKNQADTIEDAVRKASELLPDGTKNVKALALEKICTYFLSGQQDKEIQDVAIEQ